MLESLIYLAACLSEEIVNHPQLKQWAKSLQGILIQDRAPKTVLCYVRAYQTWKKWAVQCHFTAIPADPGVFCPVFGASYPVREFSAIT